MHTKAQINAVFQLNDSENNLLAGHGERRAAADITSRPSRLTGRGSLGLEARQWAARLHGGGGDGRGGRQLDARTHTHAHTSPPFLGSHAASRNTHKTPTAAVRLDTLWSADVSPISAVISTSEASKTG